MGIVVQSESSDGLIDGAIWVIGEMKQNWCVPGDFRGEFYFRLYCLGIYTNKDLGKIKQVNQEKSIPEPIRNVSQ